MKDFLGIFIMCLIFISSFLIFGGINIFLNIWGIIVFAAFCLSILIVILINQQKKLEELHERIKSLESVIKSKG